MKPQEYLMALLTSIEKTKDFGDTIKVSDYAEPFFGEKERFIMRVLEYYFVNGDEDLIPKKRRSKKVRKAAKKVDDHDYYMVWVSAQYDEGTEVSPKNISKIIKLALEKS